MVLWGELMLKRQFIEFYCEQLANEGAGHIKLSEEMSEVSPLVFSSLLNKKVSARPRDVRLANGFQVPESFSEKWESLKSSINFGEDISEYLSKGVRNWSKADFLLFCSGVSHIHLQSRNGRGVGDELVFGVFLDDVFYAIRFGCHHDLYDLKGLYTLAEESWPGVLFKKAEQTLTVESGGGYSKRVANDPKSHFNLFKPLGLLDGHQHTTFIRFEYGDLELENVPFQAYCAFSNELDYLEQLEEKMQLKCGYLADLKLSIDVQKKQYVVAVGLVKYVFKFPRCVTVSSQMAGFYSKG